MPNFFLLWNPAEWDYSNIQRLLQSYSEQGWAEEDWRFKATRQVQVGDQVWLYKTRPSPKGIFGVGKVMSRPFRSSGSDGKMHSMVKVRFEHITDPNHTFIVSEAQVSLLSEFKVGRASGNGRISSRLCDQVVPLIERGLTHIGQHGHYGPSPAFGRQTDNALATYIARIGMPRQKANGTPSRRDLDLLALLLEHKAADGSFDPTAPSIKADLDAISRLASLGMLHTDGEKCFLSMRGELADTDDQDRRAATISKSLFTEFNSALDRISNTEREALTKLRVGQSLFRKGLMEYWRGRCCLTGIAQPELLRASHIKPWSKCENDRERLDVNNGLLLAAHIDAAFDAGLISINEESAVVLSSELSKETIEVLGLGRCHKIEGLGPQHHEHLKWHRNNNGF
jgi:hypothetical protein